jgi:pimeloyl-ACP methyl ester carboxylesterase
MRRTAMEAVALVRSGPGLSGLPGLPRGDGHAVLVLPAWGRGDPYTAQIRGVLSGLGYAVRGWGLGVNVGPTTRLLDGSAALLAGLAGTYGPVSIVGFSMGGLFARWLASQMPDCVRQIVTVCSPIHDPARNFWLPLGPLLGLWPGGEARRLAETIAAPITVPGTFLFSRDDGLVNFSACIDGVSRRGENVEIDGPHVLIARNAKMMTIVAQSLAR